MDYKKHAKEIRRKYENGEIDYDYVKSVIKKAYPHSSYYVCEVMKINNLDIEEYDQFMYFVYSDKKLLESFKILYNSDNNRNEIIDALTTKENTQYKELTSLIYNLEDVKSIKDIVNKIVGIKCLSRSKYGKCTNNCNDCTLELNNCFNKEELEECFYVEWYSDLLTEIYIAIFKEENIELQKEAIDAILKNKGLMHDLIFAVYYSELVDYPDNFEINTEEILSYGVTYNEYDGINWIKKEAIITEDIIKYIYDNAQDELIGENVRLDIRLRNILNFRKYIEDSGLITKSLNEVFKTNNYILADEVYKRKEGFKLTKHMLSKLESFVALNKILGY